MNIELWSIANSVLRITDPLAWIVIAIFLMSIIFSRYSKQLGTYVAIGAWLLFGFFWCLLFPHFAFVQKSYVEGVLSLLAVPACLYTAYLLWSGRTSLLVLTRAIAYMGVLYLPFTMITPFQRWLIERTTENVYWLITTFGYSPIVVTGELGYRNTFVFVGSSGHVFRIGVILACTGIGSISVISGLIAAIDAPFLRRLRSLFVAMPIIYGLNVIRVGFIAVATGKQWFQIFVEEMLFLFNSSDPYAVSYYVSDRIISQSLSVIVLSVLVLVLLRMLPELAVVIEDVLYILTRKNYNLQRLMSTPG